MTESVPQIYEAIIKVMSDIDPIGKDSKNLQQNYKYRGIDAVYNSLNRIMARHGVFTTCVAIENEKIAERTSKGGSALFEYSAIFTYRFSTTDGSYVETKVLGKGMDSGDKDTNKAMSVAHKYALLQIFCIPTDEEKDPEVDSHEVLRSKEQVAKKQETVNDSVRWLQIYKEKISKVKDIDDLRMLDISFENYVNSDKNVFNDTQVKMLRTLLKAKETEFITQ